MRWYKSQLTETLAMTNLNPLFDKNNLVSNNLFPPVRTTTTATTIDYDLGTAQTPNFFIIADHNLTSSATIEILADDNSSFTSPETKSFTWTADTILLEDSFTTDYRYYRYNISDATNPYTIIQISKVGIGTYTQLPYFNVGSDEISNYPTVKNSSSSRQIYGKKKTQYYTYNFSIAFMEEVNKNLVRDFFNETSNLDTFFVALWEDQLTAYPLLHMSFIGDNYKFRRATSSSLEYTTNVQLEGVG